ncbi:hypothetical protein F5Y04DRAFT_278917 [Hypomontagnella monticulosa]|nr:hypothetical protein F5Y04DRAFT_278917 [Hypomontagnella monticulosa]
MKPISESDVHGCWNYELPGTVESYLGGPPNNMDDYYVWNEENTEWVEKSPLRECAAAERKRAQEYHKMVCEGKEGLGARSPTILEAAIRKRKPGAIIYRFILVYLGVFPELVYGSKSMGLEPLWHVAVESGNQTIFEILWDTKIIPAEKGSECMTKAILSCPNLGILTWLASFVPVSPSDMEALERRGMDKEPQGWQQFCEAVQEQRLSGLV